MSARARTLIAGTGGLVLAFSIVLIAGEDTVMGRVFGRAIPAAGVRRHGCMSSEEACVDCSVRPPVYLGSGSEGGQSGETGGIDQSQVARVIVMPTRWLGDGFWFPIHEGVTATVVLEPPASFCCDDSGGFLWDSELAEEIRLVALEGLARDLPKCAWIASPELAAAPFDSASFRTAPVRITTGSAANAYVYNAAGAASGLLIACALWPTRTSRTREAAA